MGLRSRSIYLNGLFGKRLHATIKEAVYQTLDSTPETRLIFWHLGGEF